VSVSVHYYSQYCTLSSNTSAKNSELKQSRQTSTHCVNQVINNGGIAAVVKTLDSNECQRVNSSTDSLANNSQFTLHSLYIRACRTSHYDSTRPRPLVGQPIMQQNSEEHDASCLYSDPKCSSIIMHRLCLQCIIIANTAHFYTFTLNSDYMRT